jgi:hypothetical protein
MGGPTLHIVTKWRRAAKLALVLVGLPLAVAAFFWPLADEANSTIHFTDSGAVVRKVVVVRDFSSARDFVTQLYARQFLPMFFSVYLAGYLLVGGRLYTALQAGALLWHSASIAGAFFLLRRNLSQSAAALMGALLFGTSCGTFVVLRSPYIASAKALGLSMVVGALVSLELFRTSERKLLLFASAGLCVLAPAATPHAWVAAPLAGLYGILVMRASGRRLLLVVVAYSIALGCYAVPCVLVHGPSISDSLADRSSETTAVTVSPRVLVRWTSAVLVKLLRKEEHLRWYRFSGHWEWLRHAPAVALGILALLSGVSLALARDTLSKARKRNLVRFGAFCFVGLTVTILLLGVFRMSWAPSAAKCVRTIRWHYVTMFFLGALVAAAADPVLAVARRILGRAGPWLIAALLVGPTVGANRMALGLYDRTMDEHEPWPGVGALMADLRALHRLADDRARQGLPTVLPSRRIPGKGRKSLSLADLDLFVTSGKGSGIRWVTRPREQEQRDLHTLLRHAPSLHALYRRYYPEVLTDAPGQHKER